MATEIIPPAASPLRLALVTGGSRGIGRAIARRLANDGRAVVISGRDETRLWETSEALSNETGMSVAWEKADVRDPAAMERLFVAVDEAARASNARLDVVVANAGIGIFKPCEETSPEEFRSVLETNLFGAFLTARLAIPRLRANGGGDIVTIGSLAGINAFPNGTTYNASKFGLNGFTEALFQEVRHDGIRVTGVLPGSVATDFPHGGSTDWMISADDVAEAIAGVLALPRRAHLSRIEIRPSRPPRKS